MVWSRFYFQLLLFHAFLNDLSMLIPARITAEISLWGYCTIYTSISHTVCLLLYVFPKSFCACHFFLLHECISRGDFTLSCHIRRVWMSFDGGDINDWNYSNNKNNAFPQVYTLQCFLLTWVKCCCQTEKINKSSFRNKKKQNRRSPWHIRVSEIWQCGSCLIPQSVLSAEILKCSQVDAM